MARILGRRSPRRARPASPCWHAGGAGDVAFSRVRHQAHGRRLVRGGYSAQLPDAFARRHFGLPCLCARCLEVGENLPQRGVTVAAALALRDAPAALLSMRAALLGGVRAVSRKSLKATSWASVTNCGALPNYATPRRFILRNPSPSS